jgi:hypothetical protein
LAEQAQNTPTIAVVGSSDTAALTAAVEAMQGAEVLGVGDPGTVRVQLAAMTIAALNKALVRADVDVDRLSAEGRSLEDVFLEVTR